MSAWWDSAAGLLTGVLSGFGVGGGTLLILWLTLVRGIDQLQAGGINLLYFAACALPALRGHLRRGMVHKRAALRCAAAGLPVCAAAAGLAAWMEVGLLRRLFGCVLLVIGAKELFGKNRKRETPPE